MPAGRVLRAVPGRARVVIRLAMRGCTNRPMLLLVAAHNWRARDGPFLEQLGCCDPMPNSHGEKVVGINMERLRHWLGTGACVSRPAEKLLGKAGGRARGRAGAQSRPSGPSCSTPLAVAGLAGFFPLHPMTITGAERLRKARAAEAARASEASAGPKEDAEE